GFAVHVFPAQTSIDEISDFDCYVLSNGPGDPDVLYGPIETTKAILDTGKPLLGICLGHQILGLASHGKTYKLKYGHHGSNQTVKDTRTGAIEVTAQNHGFVVDTSGLTDLDITYTNLNDQTIEGFIDRNRPVLSVQHHPEASPGPHDSSHLFFDFYRIVENYYSR
ncbi:MAG: gamma-glutamyl-gamma-aminobutyrate hydrolase family protein, partial [Leptonema sp. (in: Bacteria)]|nr:gamma-glutamyl-gamma-aminobutyrate hydrolase family protein [Leptonema sp. (in: bacteria)]